jgi:tetratricopeptide (TPR) repeat protein
MCPHSLHRAAELIFENLVHSGMTSQVWVGAGLLGFIPLAMAPLAMAMDQSREALELNRRGLEAVHRGDAAEAEKLYRQSIDIYKTMGPNYVPHIGVAEYNLGQALCLSGHRGEARPVLEDALALLRGSLGVRHKDTLAAMNYLGGLRLMMGDTSGAKALFQEALPIERELYPQDDQLALTLGGLSSILIREDRAEEALPLADEALSVALAADGEMSVNAALAYATAAEVHRSARRYDRALPLYRKSLNIYEKLLGPDHPRVAGVLSEIGVIEMEDHNYTLAERDMQRGLEIVQRSPGWDFEEWIAETNLGVLRLRQGKYEEAAHLLTRSLEKQEHAGIHDGHDIAITLRALAAVREKQRRYEDAKQLREREASLGAAH